MGRLLGAKEIQTAAGSLAAGWKLLLPGAALNTGEMSGFIIMDQMTGDSMVGATAGDGQGVW